MYRYDPSEDFAVSYGTCYPLPSNGRTAKRQKIGSKDQQHHGLNSSQPWAVTETSLGVSASAAGAWNTATSFGYTPAGVQVAPMYGTMKSAFPVSCQWSPIDSTCFPLESLASSATNYWSGDSQFFYQYPSSQRWAGSASLALPDSSFESRYLPDLSSNSMHPFPLVDGAPPLRLAPPPTSAILPAVAIPQQCMLLDVLSSHDDLEEATQPALIKTALKPYQKQGLTFMVRHEQEWASSGKKPDIWKAIGLGQERSFVNQVTHAHQSQEPSPCYGGIMADDMGLGKTLTMIALVATDLDTGSKQTDIDRGRSPGASTTLIIIPPSLMGTWGEQLHEHVVEGGLNIRHHHPGDRLQSVKQLMGCNIVLTTYPTITADKATGQSIIFNVRWRRIILDEAHTIRNSDSKTSQAVCALKSMSRWAVTGTPIQNGLDDLATLLKFIQAHPYHDTEQFDADISSLWESGNKVEATRRLRRLFKCLILRRKKETLELPPRRDEWVPVNLTPEERARYDEVDKRMKATIREAVKKDSRSSKPKELERIVALRRVSSLGLHHQSKSGHTPRSTSVDGQTNEVPPSKVQALIEDIRALPSGEKCVVFSEWTRTLDLVTAALDKLFIKNVRFDGKVAQNGRQGIVERFRKDRSIRVMLLTLSCGGTGLTLTEASKAYLMEPSWNPSVEEQALARIDRIGQKHKVTTVRFVARGTIEERVMEKQKVKKELERVLFSSHDDDRLSQRVWRLPPVMR